jgi:phage terminase Nu1 subunit (DNA packaging protein)
MSELVNVDRIAEVFGVSSRQVQRFALYHGLPRETRGKYDLDKSMRWFIRYLHAQVCGCDGPCEGFDRDSRDITNRRSERAAALRGIVELAPKLAGKTAMEIRELLTEALEEVYGDSAEYFERIRGLAW